MAKIRIVRPQSTGTHLYGSLREHRSFIEIAIDLGNHGDHIMEREGDDTGFKGAHRSTMKAYCRDYEERHGRKVDVGYHLEDAPEVEDHRQEVVRVAMSFEQFAEMITSTGHQVDCTIMRFSPVGEEHHVYIEEVTPPPQVYDRASRRLGMVQWHAIAEIEEALRILDDSKVAKKMKDAVRTCLEKAIQDVTLNTGFVVKQAAEEISSVVEAASCLFEDKVGLLESEGRLPVGSLDRFRNGGSQGLLQGPRPEAGPAVTPSVAAPRCQECGAEMSCAWISMHGHIFCSEACLQGWRGYVVECHDKRQARP